MTGALGREQDGGVKESGGHRFAFHTWHVKSYFEIT